ncbi:MAG: hypothetical protein Q9169_008587, partial [Polycauliona sp. 2 TL-2023]
TSTSSSTISEKPNASISSQTTALLMEGAKANWKNICETLLVGVSPDDKEILEQIMMLVERLGTGSGPLSLADHQPHFPEHHGMAIVNMGAASMSDGKFADGEGGEMMTNGEVTEQTKDGEEASEEDEELHARRERIAMSLAMRRQQQPIRK